jgi:hypothetical protein
MTIQEQNMMDELEDAITANDELMQVMDEVITLQDKMITDLAKEVDELKRRSSEAPPNYKLVPKPVYTDEGKLEALKQKMLKRR